MARKRKVAEFEFGKKATEKFTEAIDVILSKAAPTGKILGKKKSGKKSGDKTTG